MPVEPLYPKRMDDFSRKRELPSLAPHQSVRIDIVSKVSSHRTVGP
jgi:hypothetical protein